MRLRDRRDPNPALSQPRTTPLRFVSAALALAFALGGCGAPRERKDIVHDVRFGDATAMDVYLPSDEGSHPAVLFIHGGGWSGGDRGAGTGTAERLARTGYVAATIDYRLVPDAVFPENLQDCLCALSYLRRHAETLEIDPDRIAVMGYSAGGHLASLVGLAAENPELAPDCEEGPTTRPRAVIDGAGPSDLRGHDDVSVITELMGGTSLELSHAYDLASPVHHVAPGAPPFLLVHGGGDWIVPLDEAVTLRDALRAAGNDARLLELSGGGHLLNPAPNGDVVGEVSTDTPEAWLAMVDFLSRTIGEP